MTYGVAQITPQLCLALMLSMLVTSLTVCVPTTRAENSVGRALDASLKNLWPVEERASSAADLIDPSQQDATLQAQVREAYGQMPLSFELNRGQTDPRVRFLARGAGYQLFLTSTETVFKFRNNENTGSAVLRMEMAGANPQPQVTGLDELAGRSNYFAGNDQSRWQRNVPNYAKVKYSAVYEGVDVVYYGNRQQLEYDFLVAPFADPQVIALNFEGVDGLSLDSQGNLILRTEAGEVIQHAPVIYQETQGVRQTVSGRYIIKSESEVGFEVGVYDRSKPLIIDPLVRRYGTYLGGDSFDVANGIAVDAKGNAYITGKTTSLNFPRKNPDDDLIISGDAFVTKLTPDGSALVYSTFLGGTLPDEGLAIAITSDGKACITGQTGTNSVDATANSFPLTANAFQQAGEIEKRRIDAFVSVLNANGSDLVYSSYFGGSATLLHPSDTKDVGQGIAVDSTGNVYITGETVSFNLPTKGAFQSSKKSAEDAFIAKFNPAASTGPSSLLYSSYFGGGGIDHGNAIAVDKFGIAYIVGDTGSGDLKTRSPSSLPPFQTELNNSFDGYIAKFDLAETRNASLIYCTYLGGTEQDNPRAVAVDALQRTYIAGFTQSFDFPRKNAFDTTFAGSEAFITKMNADGTQLFYSSFLGGDAADDGRAIAIDAAGNAYVTGETFSSNFPTLNAFQSTKAGPSFRSDAFVAKISAVASDSVSPQLLYSTFIGGKETDQPNAIAVGLRNNAFIAGLTSSNDFPTTPGAFQKIAPGTQGATTSNQNGFIARIAEVNEDTVGTFRPSDLTFRLRNSNTAGAPDINIAPSFYQAGDLPLKGDFNGDGIDTTGIFRPANNAFILSDKVDGSATALLFFGQAGDLPVVGDWDGDGKDTIGVYRPSLSRFFLRNSNSAGPVNISVSLGGAGDIPLAGDWDGDGDDTVGVFSNNTFILSNTFAGTADITVPFGIAGDVPLTGDWDGDGDDTIGLFRNNTHLFILRNVNTAQADLVFNFAATGDSPLAGDWDGLSSNTPPNSGVNDPSEGASRAGEAQLFTTTCSDPDGWRNIHTIDFKISKANAQGTGERIALWAQFDQNRKMMRLFNPDTRRWEEGVPGANRILENRFVRLRLGGAMVDGSGPAGPSVQLTWNVVFTEAAVLDDYTQHLRIEDDAGFSTGFDEVGSWSVTQ